MSISYRQVIWRGLAYIMPALDKSYISVTTEVLKEFDLSQRPLGENFLAEHIGDFLDSNALPTLRVRGCAA